MYQMLSDEQRLVFDTVYKSVVTNPLEAEISHTTSLFFIDGRAGHGKTHFLNCLIMHLRSEYHFVTVCRSTALSATLYPRGQMAHSLFGIPVCEDNTEVHSRINPSSDRANYLKDLDLIVWEELPMSNKSTVECVNKLLQSIMGNSLPFGGKVLISLGDFHQVTPVIKNAGLSATFDASIRSSWLWPHFRILSLRAPIHNALDPPFSTWVDSVGDGIGLSSFADSIRIPPEFASCF